MFVCSGLRSRRVIIIKCGAASLLFDDMGMERPQSLGKCALFLNVSKCLILFPICQYPCPVVIRSQILLMIVSRFPGSWSRSLVTAVWHPSHSPDPDIDDRVTGDVNRYAKQAKIIHFEIDPAEVNKNIEVDIPVLGDAKETLSKIIPLIDKKSHKYSRTL